MSKEAEEKLLREHGIRFVSNIDEAREILAARPLLRKGQRVKVIDEEGKESFLRLAEDLFVRESEG
jgi:hypothetical protein